MPEPTRRAVLGALAAAAVPAVAQLPPKRPNILFILPDQVRPQDLACYGGQNVATPHIDSLAKTGVSFSNALSTCPLCTPYRSMLLSGRYPTHTGMVINWLESNPQDPSIAFPLREIGYRTAYIGKWHLNAGKMKYDGLFMSQEARALEAEGDYAVRTKVEQDYVKRNPEPEFVAPGAARRGFDFWAAYNFHTNFRRSYYYRDTPQRLYYAEYETIGQADVAIDFMRGCAKTGQPFFAVVSPHPPHQPWVEGESPSDEVKRRVRQDLIRPPNVPPEAKNAKNDLHLYYAMLASVDDAVGKLLGYLRESGLEENTIVVFSSDHGEMMGSHGKWEKMAPYEEAVRVPLIVRWPGHTKPGSVSDAIYTPMDHLPTLLGLVRAPQLSDVDGKNLSHAVLGESGTEREDALMMNYSSHWDYFHTEWPWPEWRAVRTKRHTYVKWYSGVEQLFDNEADPFQMRDIIKQAGNVNRFRDRLKGLLAESHDDFRPGHAYAEWFDSARNVRRTGWGPVGRAQ